MRIRKLTVLLLCAAVVLSIFSACGKKGPSNADKTIEYGLSAEPKTLDPQIASDSPSLTAIQGLFEGLARVDASGKAYPGVAESWKVNAENTEFTFFLRTDAKWSDKTPVTATDFVYAFRRALSPQTSSPTCSRMFCLLNARKVNSGAVSADQLGVEAKDDHTLTVRLEYPYPDFPALTAVAAFMPCHQAFFEETAGRYGLESDCVLGNGPFRIDGKYGWAHGQYLNLRRSSTYSGSRKPLPSNVGLNISGGKVDLSDPVSALQNGVVDAALIPSQKAEAASAAGCTIVSFQNTTWGLCFNTSSPLMKNANVRKAFLQAFDRGKVLSHLPKSVEKAENILLPGTTFLGENYRKLAGGPFYLPHDANASQTLARGLSELGRSEMDSVSVLCPDDLNVKLSLNEMVIAWNAQFNNYFNLETLSEEKLLSRVKSGDYQVALYPIRPESDGPLAALSQFRGGASGNAAHLDDSAYNALLSRAENENGKAAAAYYADAESYLNRQAVFYPLYYENQSYAMAKGVTGIIFHSYQGGVDFIAAGKE